MSDNTKRDLRESFPHLLRSAFDVSPPEGWVPLVERLLARIDSAIAPEDRAEFRISQIKDKFGLRIYHNGGDNIEALVDAADDEAKRTCQVCGQPGRAVNVCGWYAILCEDDEAKERAR